MVGVEVEQRIEGSPGFYTFVRHLGKMGPPSSLLFLTVDGRGDERDTGRRKRMTDEEKKRGVRGGARNGNKEKEKN